MNVPDNSTLAGRDLGRQLPGDLVAPEFGEVRVRHGSTDCEVQFTLLLDPGEEGWKTGVALDASASMQIPFGRFLMGSATPEDHASYQAKGWISTVEQDGKTYDFWDGRAVDEMIRRGVFWWSENEVEPRAREITAYLSRNLDVDGGTTVIYWACGSGAEVEVLGDFTSDTCTEAEFKGPSRFGDSTCLAPAVKYFAERFADAKRGFYIFITDGELSDLAEVKNYTIQLCQEIEAKKRNPLKCVLVGLGDQINEEQMVELDDLESGTSIDLWDHKISKTMRDLRVIFAELVDENKILASSAKIIDDRGEIVKEFRDGLPAKASFTMPATCKEFELRIGEHRIKQKIV